MRAGTCRRPVSQTIHVVTRPRPSSRAPGDITPGCQNNGDVARHPLRTTVRVRLPPLQPASGRRSRSERHRHVLGGGRLRQPRAMHVQGDDPARPRRDHLGRRTAAVRVAKPRRCAVRTANYSWRGRALASSREDAGITVGIDGPYAAADEPDDRLQVSVHAQARESLPAAVRDRRSHRDAARRSTTLCGPIGNYGYVWSTGATQSLQRRRVAGRLPRDAHDLDQSLRANVLGEGDGASSARARSVIPTARACRARSSTSTRARCCGRSTRALSSGVSNMDHPAVVQRRARAHARRAPVVVKSSGGTTTDYPVTRRRRRRVRSIIRGRTTAKDGISPVTTSGRRGLALAGAVSSRPDRERPNAAR
jgi:hypothetical protein